MSSAIDLPAALSTSPFLPLTSLVRPRPNDNRRPYSRRNFGRIGVLGRTTPPKQRQGRLRTSLTRIVLYERCRTEFSSCKEWPADANLRLLSMERAMRSGFQSSHFQLAGAKRDFRACPAQFLPADRAADCRCQWPLTPVEHILVCRAPTRLM